MRRSFQNGRITIETGDYTSLRHLFAKNEVNECYGDVTPTIGNSVIILPVRYRNLLVLPLIVWLYAPLLSHLFTRWMHDPFLSHGIFVPAFALLVLWRERNKLKAIEAAPSLVGLPLVGLALFTRNHKVWAEGELFFVGVSLLLLLAGCIITFYGWEVFRAVMFPWAFLILMLPAPPPSVLFQKFMFSLLVPTLRLAAWLLQLAGVSLVQKGNEVILNTHSNLVLLEVESGIGPFLTPLAVAIMHGYLVDHRTWVRAILACSAVPIAIVSNSFRIVAIGLFAQFWGLDEVAPFLNYSGLLIFAASLIMVSVLHRLILRIWGDARKTRYSK